jgi:mannonate dehydratase
MKLGVSHQRADMLTPGHLAFLVQMGVEAVEVRIPEAMSTYGEMAKIRDRVEEAGLHLFEIMREDRYDSPEIALGLPGRDREIERFKSFLKDLSRVGVDCTTYTWCTHSRHYAGAETMTRGCRTRSFELDAIMKCPNAYDREYTDDEMWANYEHFIREVLPVAEDVGVRLQLHPNDPPVTHEGVARIFRSTDAIRRAMEFSSHSPYSGMLFCVGTWAERFGPEGKGEDIPAAIREFGARGQIYQVHFRNVSSPMPEFVETYPDDGYVNMYDVMKALGETGFKGMVVPDHVPVCEKSDATPQAGEAYSFGYIRALMQAVESERVRVGNS